MRIVVLLLVVLFVAAAAPERLREAEAALARGDEEAAEREFRAALAHTDDPGYVAYNLGVLAAKREDWRTAELWFNRTLDDDMIPEGRAARAWYNRGLVLLRAGKRSEVYLAAMESFERCLENPSCVGALRSDAAHNLEIAKRLWFVLRQEEKARPPKPNTPTPPTRTPDPTPPMAPPMPPPMTTPSVVENATAPLVKSDGPTDPATSPSDRATKPDAGLQPVLTDAADFPPRTPEEARAALAKIASRLQKDRRRNADLVGAPERPHVPHW
jgi:tetratricopeptide (TPR) repeat protein